MYDFKIEAADKTVMYRDLLSAVDGLTTGEPDSVANMANAAALIWETLPDLNWAGFYRNVDGELVLGPFQGRPACIRIPFGTGVCGVAAQTQRGRGVSAESQRHRVPKGQGVGQSALQAPDTGRACGLMVDRTTAGKVAGR